MISPTTLLADLQPLLRALEADLRERCSEVAALDAHLRADYAAARDAKRTGEAFELWLGAQITQAAVAWILATVFVRFLEDNGLVESPRLSGPGPALQRARDAHTLYFQQRPSENDRDYLLAAFRAVAALPGMAGLFDERHNPLWRLPLSADGAARLLAFWQRIDPATGALLHDLADPAWDTRFLGDLYQDLSAEARKRYALLQTPRFVEAFILDRTLTPAIETFGHAAVRLIDPACGSGHFLLGAFQRLFECWQRAEPRSNPRELAGRALQQVAGVDLNPFAVAIARFRLLIDALRVSGIRRLADAPDFQFNLAAGDSLLHGPNFIATTGPTPSMFGDDGLSHFFAAEDPEALRRILGQRYHAVVGNPPYITVKDPALSAACRDRFHSCHRQYSLVVPFMERLFELALPSADSQPAGFVGMIAGNAFMKREFGKKLIEQYIPRWDLTHVIDTSGAYIPGHGTPTVVLFARNCTPVEATVRAVMGIRGEPSTPDDPALGLVWTAIVAQVDRPGSASEFVSVSDIDRTTLAKHPWSIGGGGVAELKELLEENCEESLGDAVDSIGFMAITAADDLFVLPLDAARRLELPCRPFCPGESIRDWCLTWDSVVVYPYNGSDGSLPALDFDPYTPFGRYLWTYRASLAMREMFGKTVEAHGFRWYEYIQFIRARAGAERLVAFAFVATHNHFVLDRGGKVFNRTAPVIKLPPDASEDDHLALLGLLNSSVACFWMKQVFHIKGGESTGKLMQSEPWSRRLEFDGTKLQQFPTTSNLRARVVELAKRLDDLAARTADTLPKMVLARLDDGQDLARLMMAARDVRESLLLEMIGWQEELDWTCYAAYGLTEPDDLVPLNQLEPMGSAHRPFAIMHARAVRAGERSGYWYETMRQTPTTEFPAHYRPETQAAVARRLAQIEASHDLQLIEQPEYKRRWHTVDWDDLQASATREWLLDRLEDARYWMEVALTSCARLADAARQDAEFMQVAELYRGHPDFDVTALVAELVESEAVPFLPVLRYKPSGLEKRRVWERTWELQRQEDAIGARVALPDGHAERLSEVGAKALKAREVGDIAAPPRYTSADFLPGPAWRLRGKLDVPKERFISYPHCARAADPSLVVAWAGWDHLQQARALAAYYVRMKNDEGWSAARLTPLLAGLRELVPWLRQWHNDLDPEFDARMGDYFADFVAQQARELGLTPEQLAAWTPPAGAAKKGKHKQAKAKPASGAATGEEV